MSEIANKSKFVWTRKRKRLIFYVSGMALPLIQLAIFYIYTNINSIFLAFKEYDVMNTSFTYVGFKNFARVFSANNGRATLELVSAIKNSFLIYGIGLISTLILGIPFANAIYKKIRGSEVFKVLLFLPSILSSVVMVILYKYFVQEAYPVLAGRLLGGDIIGPLASREVADVFSAIVFFNIFTGFGTSMLMYTGTMSGISESVTEAAKIDGITPFKEYIYITLPSIYPTISTFIVVGIAGIFTNQMNLYTFYGGAADNRLSTLGYYLYKSILSANSLSNPNVEYPYLSAFGIVITIVAVPLTLLMRQLMEKLGPKTE